MRFGQTPLTWQWVSRERIERRQIDLVIGLDGRIIVQLRMVTAPDVALIEMVTWSAIRVLWVNRESMEDFATARMDLITKCLWSIGSELWTGSATRDFVRRIYEWDYTRDLCEWNSAKPFLIIVWRSVSSQQSELQSAITGASLSNSETQWLLVVHCRAEK